MFLREAPTMTLRTLGDVLEDDTRSFNAEVSNVTVQANEQGGGIVAFPDGTELPLSVQTQEALCAFLNIPSKYLINGHAARRQMNLSMELERCNGQARFTYDQHGLQRVTDPTLRTIEPREIINVASRVIDPNALVVDVNNTPSEFRFDTIVPEGFEAGIGGDPAVGDLTRGGLRMGQDLKRNLAPWVQPYHYRLICTNGMETRDDGLRVDARGETVESVLAELEIMAQIAFGRVERQIEAFYDLRNERVNDPTGTLLRIGQEADLPANTIVSLQSRIPSIEDEAGQVTMFDLVNLITNAANDPRSTLKSGARHRLQQIGGSIAVEHAERCTRCFHRL